MRRQLQILCLFGSATALACGAAVAQPAAPPTAGAKPADGPAAVPENERGAGRLPTSDEDVIKHILPPLPADAPKPSNNPRDFEGTWVHNQITVRRAQKGMYADAIPFTPLATKVVARRSAGARGETPPYSNASAECRPPGQPWLMELYYPFSIYQSAHSVVFLYAYTHARWEISLDGPRESKPQYLGNAVGHWDGDTLVVDSTNFKRGLWLDSNGTPTSSSRLHLTHRIRRINQGDPMLEIITTVDDPVMYSKPWSFVRTYAWRPDKSPLEEYDCEMQIGAPNGAAAYGAQKEPPEERWGEDKPLPPRAVPSSK